MRVWSHFLHAGNELGCQSDFNQIISEMFKLKPKPSYGGTSFPVHG